MNWLKSRIDTNQINPSLRVHFEKWGVGSATPTFNQIEALSKATGIPLGYFFLDTPPHEDTSILEFRTIDSLNIGNPSQNLIQTVHDMKNVQDWMINYLSDAGYSGLDYVASQTVSNNSGVVAKAIKSKLGIKDHWYLQLHNSEESFRLIRESAENIGIIIMMSGIVANNTHRSLKIDEFRAFTLVDKIAPLIFINANDSYNGRLFSLVHELAHIWLGINSFFNDRNGSHTAVTEVETLCNAVAGEFLVPQSDFINLWHQVGLPTNEKIKFLSSRFCCGTTVIARKAKDNNFIDHKKYIELAQEAIEYFNATREKKRENPGGNFYSTLSSRIDKRFLSALSNSVYEGKTLYSEAYKLTNTDRHTFSTLVERIGGTAL